MVRVKVCTAVLVFLARLGGGTAVPPNMRVCITFEHFIAHKDNEKSNKMYDGKTINTYIAKWRVPMAILVSHILCHKKDT